MNRRPAADFPGDEIATVYDTARQILSFGMDRYRKVTALREYGLQSVRRQLDVGTGSGSLLLRETARDGIAVGLDREVRMLCQTKRRLRCGPVVAGDMFSLPFGATSFDLVTAAYVARYCMDPVAFIKEARRVLSDDGAVFIYDLCEATRPAVRWLFRLYLIVGTSILGFLLRGKPTIFWHLWQSMPNFRPAEFVRALHAEGFHQIRCTRRRGVFIAIVARVDRRKAPPV